MKNILKKLHSIDVADLKNISFEEIKARFQGQPDIFINICLIAATFFATMYVYNYHQSKVKELQLVIISKTEALEVVQEHKDLTQDYERLKESVPDSISTDELVGQLSEFALQHNIQILSVAPLARKSNKYFMANSVEISVTASTYIDIVKFMDAVERSQFPIRVRKWSGTIGEEVEESREGSRNKNLISAIIEIESIERSND